MLSSGQHSLIASNVHNQLNGVVKVMILGYLFGSDVQLDEVQSLLKLLFIDLVGVEFRADATKLRESGLMLTRANHSDILDCNNHLMYQIKLQDIILYQIKLWSQITLDKQT